MIEKYCNKNNINIEILEDTDYSKMIRVNKGDDVLLNLHGLHKITRVSPFGKAGKLYTSLCKVSIQAPESKKTVIINEKDIRMDFYKSTGPGGQHRNKTMSAVRLVHLPTNTMVTSAAERSQHDNRRFAYEQLQLKLEQRELLLEQNKKSSKRLGSLSEDSIVACYYLNNSLATNDKNFKKTTKIKQLLNGDLELIFKN